MNKLLIAESGRVNTISPLRILIMVMAFFVMMFVFLQALVLFAENWLTVSSVMRV